MGPMTQSPRRTPTNPVASQLLDAADRLSAALSELDFSSTTQWVYNPLDYASRSYREYVIRFARGGVRAVFLGMNPGPWGMTQTGVPFGEVNTVRDWLQIHEPIGRPAVEHPKRPVVGLACKRVEISGQRLWGLFRDRFGTPDVFFAHHYVTNYCPLVFMDDGGRNLTPDKLPREVRTRMQSLCDQHLAEVLTAMRPAYVVGIGAYAAAAARRAVEPLEWSPQPKIVQILHPSPASPAANANWSGLATEALVAAGVWEED